jgi:hypothetical protein
MVGPTPACYDHIRTNPTAITLPFIESRPSGPRGYLQHVHAAIYFTGMAEPARSSMSARSV